VVGRNRKAFMRAYSLFATAFFMTACAYVYRALGNDLLAAAAGLTAIAAVLAVVAREQEPVRYPRG
jgi:hypothetical protein